MNMWQRLAFGAIMITATCSAGQEPNTPRQVSDIYSGWRLAMQAWTFHTVSFCEAVDRARALGLRYIEVYPGQAFSKEDKQGQMHHLMPARLKEAAKEKLAAASMKVVAYGVVELPNDEAKCRKVFDFAKEMGIEVIVSEPPEDAFEMIDKLCQEYKIKVAVHNHPQPSHYWNPDTVLKVCEGRSRYIGACADTGHWTRSGLKAIEALKKLEGRIVSVHLKDLNAAAAEAHDVVWGTGVCDVNAMLAELDRQNFEGHFAIEYEYNWNNSMPEIEKCIEYFQRAAAGISRPDWKNLFEKGLTNAVMKPGAWAIEEDGTLAAKGGDGHDLDIWTKERYGNFILELEFKTPAGANSGVFIRTGSIQNWINTAIEVQIHETTDGTPHGQCGAIYDCLSPAKMAARPAGEWNQYVITCLDNKIYVELNGEEIIDMNLDKWKQPHRNPDGSPNKFPTAYKDMPREGHIGLQYHGNPVWFRNLKIKPLD